MSPDEIAEINRRTRNALLSLRGRVWDRDAPWVDLPDLRVHSAAADQFLLPVIDAMFREIQTQLQKKENNV